MIPLIQQEMIGHGWLTLQEIVDIIAISEMTPGPFAINTATFVGIRTGGIMGALFSTVGVVLPSFIIVILVAKYSTRFKDEPVVQSVLYGLRPAVIGLIASAAFLVAKTSLFKFPAHLGSGFFNIGRGVLEAINWRGILIFVFAMVGSIRLKIHPILVIISSGILGAVLFSI